MLNVIKPALLPRVKAEKEEEETKPQYLAKLRFSCQFSKKLILASCHFALKSSLYHKIESTDTHTHTHTHSCDNPSASVPNNLMISKIISRCFKVCRRTVRGPYAAEARSSSSFSALQFGFFSNASIISQVFAQSAAVLFFFYDSFFCFSRRLSSSSFSVLMSSFSVCMCACTR
jgi:hypothetical protein